MVKWTWKRKIWKIGNRIKLKNKRGINGWSRINNGDYVVTDIEGHVSIIDKKLFESLYEPLYPLSN